MRRGGYLRCLGCYKQEWPRGDQYLEAELGTLENLLSCVVNTMDNSWFKSVLLMNYFVSCLSLFTCVLVAHKYGQKE